MNRERADHRLCSWDGNETDETWRMSGENGSSLPSSSDVQPDEVGRENQTLPGFFPMAEIQKHLRLFIYLRNKLKEIGACPLL